MPPQISRLVILFAIIIALFLLLRFFLKPESFGELGHYRAKAITENLNQTPNYIGTEKCIVCHEAEAELLANDLHADLSCEGCHGPGRKHQKDANHFKLSKPSTRLFCGQCHSENKSRPEGVIKQIDMATHNVENNCIECHNSHAPWN